MRARHNPGAQGRPPKPKAPCTGLDLLQLRESQGVKPAELAEKIHSDPKYIVSVESGRRVLTLEFAARVVKGLAAIRRERNSKWERLGVAVSILGDKSPLS